MKKNRKSDNKALKQNVQIIAGTHRHRKIEFIGVEDLRPTGARLRETLFNWLQPYIYNSHCIDLFAGSGILGFEALSRGAKKVTFVEKNPQAARQIEQNVRQLGINEAEVICNDFRNVLTNLPPHMDIIFLDPPYTLRLLPELLEMLHAQYSPKFIFIEDNQPFQHWIETQNYYQIRKNKKAGNIYYGLLCPNNTTE